MFNSPHTSFPKGKEEGKIFIVIFGNLNGFIERSDECPRWSELRDQKGAGSAGGNDISLFMWH